MTEFRGSKKEAVIEIFQISQFAYSEICLLEVTTDIFLFNERSYKISISQSLRANKI